MKIKQIEKTLKVALRDTIDLKKLNTEELKQYIDKMIIWYPKLQEILNDISVCHKSYSSGHPEFMSFFGKERVGKTFIIDYYCKQYPRYTQKDVISIRNRLEAAEITYIPVLYVRMPCPANLGGLTGKIFEALGDPFSHHKHHIVEQTKAIRGLLKRCGVQLLIFDEVQHFVDRDKKKLLIESSDWFKNLIDETEIPTILVGTREAEKIFINDQLNGRFFLRQELEPFNCHDIVGC